MLTLNNSYLTVAVLDPANDLARFGARYCTGGYIFQVTDQRAGDLLSGPTYPYSFDWFDGQGIPDSFRTHLVDPTDTNNPHELGIGIGMVRRTDNQVTEFCQWTVTEERGEIQFATKQAFLGWSFDLTRTLRLVNRTLISQTSLHNTGHDEAPVYWFPHPFFPHYESGECCKLNVAIRLPENPGYELADSGFIRQRNLPWAGRGFFHELDFDKGQHLVVLQKHPKLGLISATFDYAPAYFPIWGNKNTFSFEPYFQASVAQDSQASWSVTYDF